MLIIENGKLLLRRLQNAEKLSPEAGQIILLTGGVASGKTFALDIFEGLGFAVFNTDTAIKSAMESDLKIIGEVARQFPKCVKLQNNRLVIDRVKLSDVIFFSTAGRKQLEDILYKHIQVARSKFIREIRTKYGESKSIVIEIPMLFEKLPDFPGQFYPIFEFTKHCFVVSVISTLKERYRRALRRKNMTKEKFRAIITMQMSDDYRLEFSDYLVIASGAVSRTQQSIRSIVTS